MGFLSRKPKEWDVDEVLARQLAMNRQSWATLQQHGVTPDTEVRLDFFYVASSREQAESLATFLRTETDYDVAPGTDGVTGTTQPTTVNAEILDQWVAWMVHAGADHGRCEFDGWGAEVPREN